jgi:hypothetical protein
MRKKLLLFTSLMPIVMALSAIPCKAQSAGPCVIVFVANVGCSSKGCTNVVQVESCSNIAGKTHCYFTGSFTPCCATNIAQWASGDPCGGPKTPVGAEGSSVMVMNGRGGFDFTGPPSCSIH